MRVIGLTGSIACGKSTISRYLVSCGFPVVDGDQLSRDLTAPGSPVLDEIRRNFGDRYMNENGNLNRRALGQLIFRDEHARTRLDAVMAPHLMRLTQERIDRYRAEGAQLCFLDMPLLFEKGYDRLCDSVWTVWLPEDVQLSRLMARDQYSKEDAMNRIRSVMSSNEKAKRADHVIDNSGSVRKTLDTVDQLLTAELFPPDRIPSPESQPPVRSGNFPSVPVSPAVPQPPVQVTVDPPDRMERPAAPRQTSRRKSEWTVPLWLKVSLISLSVILAVGVAAFWMMSGYLADRQKQHREEQRQIDINYPYPEYYREMIETRAAEYNLNPAFVASVIMNESSFRENVSSGVGARGMMQLMPDTAGWIAGKLNVSDYSFEKMLDPDTNIRFGCWYLNYLNKEFNGNPVCIISAYHTGQGKVREWLTDRSVSDDGRTIRLERLPEGPTKNYATEVIRDYGIYQEKWFPAASAIRDAGGAGSAVR